MVPSHGSGTSTHESFAWFDHASSLWRTSPHCSGEACLPYSETWPSSGTMQSGIAYRRAPLVPHKHEKECSFWPTPTAKANHMAPSMRKWPGYARMQDELGGQLDPSHWEWLMGFPIGWTDLEP
jgi:hypothetical protein